MPELGGDPEESPRKLADQKHEFRGFMDYHKLKVSKEKRAKKKAALWRKSQQGGTQPRPKSLLSMHKPRMLTYIPRNNLYLKTNKKPHN